MPAVWSEWIAQRSTGPKRRTVEASSASTMQWAPVFQPSHALERGARAPPITTSGRRPFGAGSGAPCQRIQ